ncbi:MAG: SnoaL-like domain-containing protein [Candidatus Cyclobacteriaceae bacterium M3_2C_046]
MNYLERTTSLYNELFSGNISKAFDQYYHPDLIMVEATGETRKGMEANKAFEKKWSDQVTIHRAEVKTVTANEAEKTTMVESFLDITFSDGYRRKIDEVAVQRYQDDKIIYERFYYYVGK